MKQPSYPIIGATAIQWVVVVASIAAATLGRWLLDPLLGVRLPYVAYFVAIYFIAWYTGLWPSVVALFVAWWAADFFFIAPRYAWWPHGQIIPDFIGTAMYFMVGGTSIVICQAMRSAKRRAAEQAERLQTTVASIGDAVIATDLDGRITSLNRVAESLTGWTTSEALGQPLDAVFRIVNEQTRQKVENPANRALREGIIVGLANHTVLIAKDGTERPIDDSAAPIRCKEGKIVGCVLVFRDVTERRRADEARARLAAIVETSDDAIVGKTLEGIIFSWNAAAERIFGYSASETVGQSINLIIPAELQDEERSILKRLRSGERISHFETSRAAKNGRRIDISLTISPIRDSAGRIVGASKVARDITDHKRSERALQESEARKTAILEMALDCIITIDHEGKIIEFNPSAERTFGYRRDDALGREMAELIVPPSLRQRHYQGLAHYLATGEGPVLSKRIQMPALRADGTELPVELTITAIRRQDTNPIFTAFLRDITALTRTESRRAARLAVTQILAEAATVGEAAPRIIRAICESLGWDVGAIWLPDPQANVLRCVEVWRQPTVQIDEFEASTRQLTFPPGVGLPGRIWSNGQPDWIPDVVQDDNFPRAPIADREGLHGAFGFPLVIGSEFLGVIEFFSHEIREPDVDLLEMMTTIGSQVGYFIERKRAEETLRRVAADLSEADRRKNEFLAMLAHELRNPLAPIRNALQIMRLTGGDGQALDSASEMMERQIGQMVRLVDDLLDVSRISRGKIELRREPVELASVVHHAVEAAESMIQCAGHQLTVALPPEPIYLQADATRLAQVIGNLLNNARKFTDKGGRIWLTVERDGEQAAIRVKDTGIGIAADQLYRIFDMFAQVDTSLERSESGLGIGLTLVKNLVDMHGGTVEVHSAGIGQGSEFVVRLPIMSGEQRAASDEPEVLSSLAPRLSPLATKRRILVVDDNQDAATSLATLLTLSGHQTQTAHDGLEAVEAAAMFRPETILLDIGLPKLNGYEAARRIRDQPWGKNIVLVALTGWGQDEDRRKSKAAGFDAHLVKPVDLAALKRLLAESVTTPV